MKPEIKEEFYADGNILRQEWYLNGKYHNEEGPAHIKYYKNGNIWHQAWYLNGKYHNEEGPGYIVYNEDGNVEYQSWYVNDKYLFKKDFTSLNMIKRMDAFEFFSPLEIARMKI
jgi:antitoxin component YwqK of YwqJK toxin-antitoxin module